MSWDKRGYFYRSRRVGSRVVREYFGRGPLAEMAAYLLGELHRARAAHYTRTNQLDAADIPFRQLQTQLDQVAAAHLLVAGYHRHDRGPWKRRRDAERH